MVSMIQLAKDYTMSRADSAPAPWAQNAPDDLESEVRSLIHNELVPSRKLPPMPDYVEHNPEVDDVGRLTSEALLMSYEASAKRLEEMGQALLEEMKQVQKTCHRMAVECERVTKETEEAVDQCQAAAQVYRDQAKIVFEQIERRAVVADNTRKACAAAIEEIKNT